jgi:flavin reductase (DIM6/NTAB) family NADH-FMN oxidoreductase RutF
VTCCDAEGQPNIIAIAWLVPVSASPPLVGMGIRPTRHSYGLIQATGEFVINVAPHEIAQQAIFCGRRSGRNVDKFAATSLTPRLTGNCSCWLSWPPMGRTNASPLPAGG